MLSSSVRSRGERTSLAVKKGREMRNAPQPTSVAYAPWGSGDREWLVDRQRIAAEWLTTQARRDGSQIVVQGTAHARDYREDSGPMGVLAREGRVATYKSPVGPGATYAHHADIKLLAAAMSTAEGHALVVTELPTLPLDGWAQATGATNLASGAATVDSRTAEQIALFNSFVGQLYNGWSHKEVRRRASGHYLPKLVETGMSYTDFVGSLLAVAPAYLADRADIAEMTRALPPVWAEQALNLREYWSRG